MREGVALAVSTISFCGPEHATARTHMLREAPLP